MWSQGDRDSSKTQLTRRLAKNDLVANVNVQSTAVSNQEGSRDSHGDSIPFLSGLCDFKRQDAVDTDKDPSGPLLCSSDSIL